MARYTAKAKELLGRTYHLHQSQGSKAALTHLWQTTGNYLFRRTDFFLLMRPVAADLVAPTIPHLPLVVRAGNLEDLWRFQPLVESSRLVWWQNLLEQRRIWIIVLWEEQPVAYGWFSTDVTPRLERMYVPLGSGEAYMFDLYTVPSFRQQGFQKLLHAHMLGLMDKLKYQRVFSVVKLHNLPSLSLHYKLGYQIIARLTWMQLLGWMYFRYTPDPFEGAGQKAEWVW